jgi:hypothetical protein
MRRRVAREWTRPRWAHLSKPIDVRQFLDVIDAQLAEGSPDGVVEQAG